MTPLSPSDLDFLSVIRENPNPIDLSTKSNLETRTLAKRLIDDGYLWGPLSRVSLSAKGYKALKEAGR